MCLLFWKVLFFTVCVFVFYPQTLFFNHTLSILPARNACGKKLSFLSSSVLKFSKISAPVDENNTSDYEHSKVGFRFRYIKSGIVYVCPIEHTGIFSCSFAISKSFSLDLLYLLSYTFFLLNVIEKYAKSTCYTSFD